MAVADHPCPIRRWCYRENFRRRTLVRQWGISVYILMGIMPFVAPERNEPAGVGVGATLRWLGL